MYREVIKKNIVHCKKTQTEFHKNSATFYFFTVFSTLFYPCHYLFRLFLRDDTF